VFLRADEVQVRQLHNYDYATRADMPRYATSAEKVRVLGG
jgi:hypothetical protein